MNKLFLWIVGLLNPLWQATGADPKAIRLILNAKLKMDDRGGYVMGRQQAPKKGMEYLTFFFMTLFGLLLIFLPVYMEHKATAMGLAFSFWMVYIGLLLVTELSETLFDARDLYVLLTRPINDITLSLSRILHIGVFTSKFALCLGAGLTFYWIVGGGIWATIVYILLAVMAVIMTMAGTLVFYLILLRRVAASRVKKIIGYFQIVASTVFFLLYQIPNLVGVPEGFEGIRIVGEWLGFLFPGLWLGGLWSLLVEGGATGFTWLQAGLALFAVIGGSWFYLNQSRDYSSNLLALRQAGSVDSAEKRVAKTKPGNSHSPWRDRFASWLTKDHLERASFKFHWSVMQRDMSFKQRTYPSMVFLPIILLVAIFRGGYEDGKGFFSGELYQLFVFLYMVILIIIIPLAQTKISQNFRASWIFLATPNSYPGQLSYGQIMSVWTMFFLPTALIVYPLCIFAYGLSAGFDIILAAAVTLIFSLLFQGLDKNPPFSQELKSGGSNTIGPMIMVFVLAPLAGVGHYFLSFVPYAIPVAGILAWASLWLIIRNMRNSMARSKA